MIKWTVMPHSHPILETSDLSLIQWFLTCIVYFKKKCKYMNIHRASKKS